MRISRSAGVVLLVGIATLARAERRTPLEGTPPGQLIAESRRNGHVRVIVGARDDEWRPEGLLNRDDVERQRLRGKQRTDAIIAAHPSMKVADRRFKTLPAFVAAVHEKELEDLIEDDRVRSLEQDITGEFLLKESIVTIGASVAHSAQPTNFTGSGQIVVVIDSGVDKTHPFFGNPSRILDTHSACFSGAKIQGVGEVAGSNNWTTVCPNGETEQSGVGSAVPCSLGTAADPINNCYHGTKVAGIVIGDNGEPGPDRMTGVAPSAKVIAIQVASKNCSQTPCSASILKASVIHALDYVTETLSSAYPGQIVAVNLSTRFPADSASACDTSHPTFKDAVANVVSQNIAVIAASGNNGNQSAIGVPACFSNVIAVSATNDSDQVPNYANVGPNVHLFAPGGTDVPNPRVPGFGGIKSSQSSTCSGCDPYWEDSGTSFAAPHVAGSFALLRQKHSGASIQSLLGTLVRTGVLVTDMRPAAPTVTKPRINVSEALDQPLELPPPTALTATATGSNTISLSWVAAIPAIARTSYRMKYRTAASGVWTDLAETQGTSVIHNGVSADVVYEYEVTLTDAVGNSSIPSKDFALELFHADDPITPQVTPIRGGHIAKLREAADAWRNFAGLPDSFTYEQATGVVTAADVAAILAALNAARSAIGLSTFTYAGISAPQVGATIDARHVQQLRVAMR